MGKPTMATSPAPAPNKKPRSRFWRVVGWGALFLILLTVVALGVGAWYFRPYLGQAKLWWKEAIEVADAHARHEVAHQGWSFPARLHTSPTPLTLPIKKLVIEAKARGYAENCPAPGPGEFCEKTEKVVPKGVPGGAADMLEPIELGWLMGPDAEMRIHLPLADAPKHLIDAILAAEDRIFYQHNGVNFSAVVRAAYLNAKEQAVIQGGSTLTMQLVRNMVQRKEKTLERKAREMVMAMAIDQHLGKEQVLQMYLDAPYLGQRGGVSICGFEAASRHYFGKSARDISLAEAATLAAILPAPGKFAPDRFPQEALERRNRVLQAMEEAFGYKVRDALLSPISTSNPEVVPERYPAWISATRAWLETRVGPQVLYGAGLNVTVGMDIFRQEVADEVFAKKVPYLENVVGRQGDAPLQAAAVMMDVQTGLINVIYGGSDATAISFNRATQARRQAGSSFKPLVYALAFSQSPGPDGKPLFTAAHAVPNSPRVFKTPQGDWSPRNIAGEYTVTACLAEGLTWSQNIATASLLDEVGGAEKLVTFADKMGFDTSKFPHEMGLALGQGEVTPLEMCRWVAIVANGGKMVEGTPVLRAVDAAGQERISPPVAGEQVLSPEAAVLTRELMRLVIDMGTGGAARGGGGEMGYPGPAMGKTGTTDKEKDLWFTGATPTLAAVLWLGYDLPTRIRASASDFASPLWGWWMNRSTRYDGTLPQFSKEPKFVRRDVCKITGKVPNETCGVLPAPFLPGTGPREVCPEDHPPPTPDPDASPAPELLLEGGIPEGDGRGPDGQAVPGVGTEGGSSLTPASPATADGTEPVKPEKKRRGHQSIWQRMAQDQEEKAAEKAKKAAESAPPKTTPR